MSLFMDNVKHSILKAKQLGCYSFSIEQNQEKFYAQFDTHTSIVSSSKTSSFIPEDDIFIWRSPMVGYIQIVHPLLDSVHEDQSYIKITALGLSHDVPVPFKAEVFEWHIEEGQSMMFGQPIATLKRIK